MIQQKTVETEGFRIKLTVGVRRTLRIQLNPLDLTPKGFNAHLELVVSPFQGCSMLGLGWVAA